MVVVTQSTSQRAYKKNRRKNHRRANTRAHDTYDMQIGVRLPAVHSPPGVKRMPPFAEGVVLSRKRGYVAPEGSEDHSEVRPGCLQRDEALVERWNDVVAAPDETRGFGTRWTCEQVGVAGGGRIDRLQNSYSGAMYRDFLRKVSHGSCEKQPLGESATFILHDLGHKFHAAGFDLYHVKIVNRHDGIRLLTLATWEHLVMFSAPRLRPHDANTHLVTNPNAKHTGNRDEHIAYCWPLCAARTPAPSWA